MTARAKRRIVAFLIILTGVIMFNYPTLATLVNNIFAYREVGSYEASVDELTEEQIRYEIDMALAYNQSLPMSFPADPFTETNINKFEGTEFETFDMVQDGAVIGYIEIPSIDIYQPIYYGTSDEVLDKGLGVVENSSLPVGGPGTHSVISAHSGLASRKLFTDLDKVEKGELFFVHVLDRNMAYRVDQIKVVLPENADDLRIQRDKDYITLLTCTPFGVNDHRLLVRGVRTEYDFSQPVRSVAEKRLYWLEWVAILLAGLLFILLILIVFRREKRRDGRKGKGKRKRRSNNEPETQSEQIDN